MIIAITGSKESGKSTIAKILLNHFPDAVRMAFADPIKQMVTVVTEAFGVHDACYAQDMKESKLPEIGVSARYLMQTLGTEWGRDKISPFLWSLILEARLKTIFSEDSSQLVIIDDLRFNTERESLVIFAWKLRQQIIFIEVSTTEKTSVNFFEQLKAWLFSHRTHRSERPINFSFKDFVISLVNNKDSIDDLTELVKSNVLPHID